MAWAWSLIAETNPYGKASVQKIKKHSQEGNVREFKW